MDNEDIRWKQRFSNYEKALNQLIEGFETSGPNPISIIKQAIIPVKFPR